MTDTPRDQQPIPDSPPDCPSCGSHDVENLPRAAFPWECGECGFRFSPTIAALIRAEGTLKTNSDRVLAMAEIGTAYLHSLWPWDHDYVDGHAGPIETCPHEDCLAVRELRAAGATAAPVHLCEQCNLNPSRICTSCAVDAFE